MEEPASRGMEAPAPAPAPSKGGGVGATHPMWSHLAFAELTTYKPYFLRYPQSVLADLLGRTFARVAGVSTGHYGSRLRQ